MWVCGGGYTANVCMYAALFRLSFGIVTQTARRRESVPNTYFPVCASKSRFTHHFRGTVPCWRR